jgi:hypothetical protein
MHGRDFGRHSAWDAVLLLHEGGEEQPPLPALEEQLSRQPETGSGTEGRDVRGAAPHLPAEQESF